ncbi:hypothetical protein PCL_06818 [Purpureocillium lilacinum]|uniref:Secreted protein n=1 Tax=Purpureocillium lilacinum TaxID=33203 RepID=A0A179GIT4_PURLI|nr:hypothetical protein Purlil1_9595 [Purpureocillium lilacinum]OAQ77766.1 hypothetical protein VFPBJ_08238 [Purpureocillium lilacinum]PWI65613.1 hypothetical protein PCL_06818 [Purpureocillium lilacinum]GJN74743.1 hypothetical protein PLICBS_008836 [Purpureocillium lilacinum]
MRTFGKIVPMAFWLGLVAVLLLATPSSAAPVHLVGLRSPTPGNSMSATSGGAGGRSGSSQGSRLGSSSPRPGRLYNPSLSPNGNPRSGWPSPRPLPGGGGQRPGGNGAQWDRVRELDAFGFPKRVEGVSRKVPGVSGDSGSGWAHKTASATGKDKGKMSDKERAEQERIQREMERRERAMMEGLFNTMSRVEESLARTAARGGIPERRLPGLRREARELPDDQASRVAE